MRLDGFGLLVSDMGTMIRFYRDVLGFEIREAEDSSNVYLVKDGTLFLLYGRKDFEKMTGHRYDYIRGLNGHFEIALYVDSFEEVDTAFRKAVENGARGKRRPAGAGTHNRTLGAEDLLHRRPGRQSDRNRVMGQAVRRERQIMHTRQREGVSPL